MVIDVSQTLQSRLVDFVLRELIEVIGYERGGGGLTCRQWGLRQIETFEQLSVGEEGEMGWGEEAE